MEILSNFQRNVTAWTALFCVFCLSAVTQTVASDPSADQVAAAARFANNFPYIFHFGGRLNGSIVASVLDVGACRLTTSQADPQKPGSPDVSQLDFDEPFWIQIAVQKDGTKSKVLAVYGVAGQTASRRAATFYFDRSQRAQVFTNDLANLVRACGGTVEVKTAVLPAALLSPP